MKVGDLVKTSHNGFGVIVGFWEGFFGETGVWVLLMDNRKRLFEPTRLEVI